jgi:hypothetical protein
MAPKVAVSKYPLLHRHWEPSGRSRSTLRRRARPPCKRIPVCPRVGAIPDGIEAAVDASIEARTAGQSMRTLLACNSSAESSVGEMAPGPRSEATYWLGREPINLLGETAR